MSEPTTEAGRTLAETWELGNRTYAEFCAAILGIEQEARGPSAGAVSPSEVARPEDGPMTEPMTRAGSLLVRDIVEIIDGEWGTGNPAEIAATTARWAAGVLAIEREARRSALDDVRREVETLPETIIGGYIEPTLKRWDAGYVRTDGVLAILDRLSEKPA